MNEAKKGMKKNKGKKRRLRIFLLLVVFAVVIGMGVAGIRQLLLKNKYKNRTSFDYKLYENQEAYNEELKLQMERVYDTIGSAVVEADMIPIPGLINTSYKTDEETKNSAYYVPQGLCLAGDYILISAYHNGKLKSDTYEENKGWDSVIYVVDATSLDYIATLNLPHNYHNGGIAFDGNNVWLCGNTKDSYLKEGNAPFVQCLKYSVLQEKVEAVREKHKENADSISDSDLGEKIYIANTTSFLECDNGYLWVGTYINNEVSENKGYAVGYPILNGEGQSPTLDTLRVLRINHMPSSSQGMDISGDSIYVSSSGHGGENWNESSFVTRYDIGGLYGDEKILTLNEEDCKKVEVPKMNEEIIVTDDTVAIIFESGAEEFIDRFASGMKTDRVLALDKKLWE